MKSSFTSRFQNAEILIVDSFYYDKLFTTQYCGEFKIINCTLIHNTRNYAVYDIQISTRYNRNGKYPKMVTILVNSLLKNIYIYIQ